MEVRPRRHGCLVRRHDFVVLPGAFSGAWELAVMAVDDLRTKIAAATVGHADYVSGLTRYCTCGQWSGDSTGTRIDFSRHLADAVIRELNLTEDGGVIVGCAHE